MDAASIPAEPFGRHFGQLDKIVSRSSHNQCRSGEITKLLQRLLDCGQSATT